MSLNYHHLHCFWAIAEEGSLTRAAKRLHVTHSTLSVQLRALEDVARCGAVRSQGAWPDAHAVR